MADLTDRRRAGVRLNYRPEAFDRWAAGAPVISCSLPLRRGRHDATAFFDGLLPERPHRGDLASRAGVAANDTFGLLARYGREIAGALVVSEGDDPPDRSSGVVDLDEAALADEVAELPERPLGIHDDSELSLTGIGDKMLLVEVGPQRWARPVGATPSTHILKLDHRVHHGLVAAEADALALARAAGLSRGSSQVLRVGDLLCIVVERFDRVREGGVVVRVHQEDICQATGRAPTQKYELRQGGGGPMFREVANLLDTWGADPLEELDRLAGVAAFTAVIGNADGHGKNLAVAHEEPGRVRLAPLYDQVPTGLWSPPLTADAAMSIGGAVSLTAVDLDAIAREAKTWRHDPDRAVAAARAAVEAVLGALDADVIDPAGRVATFVRPRAEAFLEPRKP